MTMFVVRYFWGVSPHFSHTAVVFFGLACFGVWAVTTLPNDVGAAYVPILFCQLFGASSGFRPAADEGRFDALLVSGGGDTASRSRTGCFLLAPGYSPGRSCTWPRSEPWDRPWR